MRKTRRHPYTVSYGDLTQVIEATSYGNAVAKFRRANGTPHWGAERDGGFIGYSVETPADRRRQA